MFMRRHDDFRGPSGPLTLTWRPRTVTWRSRAPNDGFLVYNIISDGRTSNGVPRDLFSRDPATHRRPPADVREDAHRFTSSPSFGAGDRRRNVERKSGVSV